MKRIVFLILAVALLMMVACKKDYVTGVSLDRTTLTLDVGETKNLTAAIKPANAANKEVTWTSSDNAVATVENGVVTAIDVGNATIDVTTIDGRYRATCNVTVKSQKQIIITVGAGNGVLELYLAGSGKVTTAITHARGTDINTHTLRNDSDTGFNYFNISLFGIPLINNGLINNGFIITISGENITHFKCVNQKLTNLNVSKNSELTYLDCNNSKLIDLDVSKNTKLTYLDCSNNQLTSLVVNNNTELTYLDCNRNSLISLDVSKNTKLTHLNSSQGYFSSNDLLTNIDISANTELTYLNCSNNLITKLDVNRNTKLTYLNCFNNKLTSLYVNNNTELTDLNCAYNELEILYLSNNFKLIRLECQNNKLPTIDTQDCIALREFGCHNNELQNLVVSKNPELTKLAVFGNQFTSIALNQLFETLHENAVTKEVAIGSNPGTGGCNQSIAKNKGWKVVYFN